MQFTAKQAGILFDCWALSSKGMGQVLVPDAEPEAEELAGAGWLEKRTEENGDISWWWTPQAEMALDLNELAEGAKGRVN